MRLRKCLAWGTVFAAVSVLAGATDLRPLAGLGGLLELDIRGCEKVDDLAPIRRLLRRGVDVSVADRLKPQLETLRATTDF